MDEELSLLQAGYLMPLILGIGLFILLLIILAVCFAIRGCCCCRTKRGPSAAACEPYAGAVSTMPNGYEQPAATLHAGTTGEAPTSFDADRPHGETPLTSGTNGDDSQHIIFDGQQPVGDSWVPSAEPLESQTRPGGSALGSTRTPSRPPLCDNYEGDESDLAPQTTADISSTADARGAQPTCNQLLLKPSGQLPFPEFVYGGSQSTAASSSAQMSHRKRPLSSLRSDKRLDAVGESIFENRASGRDASEAIQRESARSTAAAAAAAAAVAVAAPIASTAYAADDESARSGSTRRLHQDKTSGMHLDPRGKTSNASGGVAHSSHIRSAHSTADRKSTEKAVTTTTARDASQLESAQQPALKEEFAGKRQRESSASFPAQRASNGGDDTTPSSLLPAEQQATAQPTTLPPADTIVPELDGQERSEMQSTSQEPAGQSAVPHSSADEGAMPGNRSVAASADAKSNAKAKSKADARERKARKRGRDEEEVGASTPKRRDGHRSRAALARSASKSRSSRDRSKKAAASSKAKELAKSSRHRVKSGSLKKARRSKSKVAPSQQSSSTASVDAKSTSEKRRTGEAQRKKHGRTPTTTPPKNPGLLAAVVLGQRVSSDDVDWFTACDDLSGTSVDEPSGKKKAPANDGKAGAKRTNLRSVNSKKKTPVAFASKNSRAAKASTSSAKKRSKSRSSRTDSRGGRRH